MTFILTIVFKSVKVGETDQLEIECGKGVETDGLAFDVEQSGGGHLYLELGTRTKQARSVSKLKPGLSASMATINKQ